MSLGTEVDLGPGHIVLGGDPAPPSPKGGQQPPLFGPCLLWPRSSISATAELLFVSILFCKPSISVFQRNVCFVALGLVSPVYISQEIGCEERLRNELSCVE